MILPPCGRASLINSPAWRPAATLSVPSSRLDLLGRVAVLSQHKDLLGDLVDHLGLVDGSTGLMAYPTLLLPADRRQFAAVPPLCRPKELKLDVDISQFAVGLFASFRAMGQKLAALLVTKASFLVEVCCSAGHIHQAEQQAAACKYHSKTVHRTLLFVCPDKDTLIPKLNSCGFSGQHLISNDAGQNDRTHGCKVQ